METLQPLYVGSSSVWPLLMNENIFTVFSWNFIWVFLVLIASFPVTKHHLQESICIFFLDCHQVFIDVDSSFVTELSLSRLSRPSFPSLSMYSRYCNTLIIFVALHWAHSSHVHVSLELGRPEPDPAPRCALKLLSRGERSPPLPCWQQYPLCSSGCHGI